MPVMGWGGVEHAEGHETDTELACTPVTQAYGHGYESQ